MANSKEIFSKNVKYLLKKNDLSRETVARVLGVKYTTFCDWVKGRSYPKMEYIKEIADFFCVALNGLLEENPDYEMCMELYRQEHEPKGMFTQYFVYEINKLSLGINNNSNCKYFSLLLISLISGSIFF